MEDEPVTPTTVPTRVAAAPALLVAAILLLALNMRGPIVAVSAVTEAIRADLGVDGGTVGLLTSLPVLCFGLATPPASALLARLGLGRGVLVALAVLLAGIVVRSLGGLPAALVGTVLIGAAITVANVAVPVVVGRGLADADGPRAGGVHRGVERRVDAHAVAHRPDRGRRPGGRSRWRAGGCWWSSRPGSGGGRPAPLRPQPGPGWRPPSPLTRAKAGGAARCVGPRHRLLGTGVRLLRHDGLAAGAVGRPARDDRRTGRGERLDLRIAAIACPEKAMVRPQTTCGARMPTAHIEISSGLLTEEKAAAVRMVRALRAELGTEQGTVQRVARQLGYGVESVRMWVRQADIDEGLAPGVSTAESARVKELEQENRELKRANEILKRAASFFGAELDRQHKK